ncbi:MAG: NAD(P)/FAD-dependent oxidoreductase, partial [Clostridia bacterium]|nr:NAD(P)/FAD-dependent oxidoreductase [Clostridia bacterium]
MLDAVIIGGGVVGGMIARALAVYDLKTAILEKEGDVAMGATRANSAIVHAGFDAKEGSLKALLNVRGAEMMEDVAKALDVPYQRNGSLVVGFSDTDRDHLLSLCERGKRNGVKGLCVLEKEDLLKIEPGVGEGVSCALYAPTGAIVCPYELAIAAIGNAMDNGASLYLRFAVTAIMAIEGGYRITAADGRAVEAKNVINCAGLYADDIARMVGDDSFSIHPRRGEYMLLDKECGALCEKTIFRCPTKMGKGILVSPTVDGNLLLGPTAEDGEDKEDRRTTSRGLASFFAAAKEQVANLPNGKSITSFAGLRAVGSTGDFIINLPRE